MGYNVKLSIEDYIIERHIDGNRTLYNSYIGGLGTLIRLMWCLLFVLINSIKILVNLHEATILSLLTDLALTISIVVAGFMVEFIIYSIRNRTREVQRKRYKKVRISDKDIRNGYRLKLVEEMDFKGYKKLLKEDKQYRNEDDGYERFENSLKRLVSERVDVLNLEIELDNGYVTRMYEMVSIHRDFIIAEPGIKKVYELGEESGVVSVPKLNEDTVIDWYKNLSEVTQNIEELDRLEEEYRLQKEKEEKRLEDLRRIEQENLIRKQKENDNKRAESLTYLGKSKLTEDLKVKIDQVYKDNEEVYLENDKILSKIKGGDSH